MKKELISDIKKNLDKSTEYPFIYTYIYERESKDLDRLYTVFEQKDIKRDINTQNKTIVKYEVDKDGKLIPIYKNDK